MYLEVYEGGIIYLWAKNGGLNTLNRYLVEGR